MKKLMKRTGAILMAIAMMAALSVSAWASQSAGDPPASTTSTTPSTSDVGTVTVQNVKSGDGAKVIAYKIVNANYTVNGFTGFSAIDGVTIADITKPTADEITTIAKAIQAGTVTAAATELTANGTTWTKDLTVGEYIILVTNGTNDKTIYNPMVASVYYAASDGSIQAGTVDAKTDYTIAGSTSFAKSDEPGITKEITNNSVGDAQGTKGDDHKVGDIVNFKVTTAIPAYSKEYTDVIFEISDHADEGLALDISDMTVKIDGADADMTKITVTPEGDNAKATQDMKLSFNGAYALANAGKTVEVVYKGKITDAATVNFDPTTNTAKVKYSRNPTNKNDCKEKEDKTHHYSFEIDGSIIGGKKHVVINSEKERYGHELIKVNENGEPEGTPQWVNDGETELKKTISEGQEVKLGLKDAEFTLTQIKDAKNNTISNGKTWTATTNENGYFNGFTHLDAGTYTLQETKAPGGYTLNTDTHEVVITAEYNTDGTLKKYEIKIDGKKTSTYTATYGTLTTQEVGEVKITEITNPSETFYIKNTKTAQLPSTGGIGTYVFTVAGVAIMAVAAGLLIVRHKKKT